MSKVDIGVDVLTAAKQRICLAFDNFEKICISYSGGKDSNVMMHLVMEEAIKRNKKVAVLFIDFEAQYKYTVTAIEKSFKIYKKNIEPYWVCLPIHLRNAVSVYEPFWKCWDADAKLSWVRKPPKIAITDEEFFPFFKNGMEFEEFVPEFAEWYSDGIGTAFFVGIRSDESYNRYLTIASSHKTMFDYHRYTTKVCENSDSYNFYPLYDWKTEDVWKFFGKNKHFHHNEVYDKMHLAGLSISQQRLCQPYGDDQRKGLWLFHLIEPETWGKIIARVNGANGGSLYAKEHGNINGYRKISKPDNITWKEFAYRLILSMPQRTKEHYSNKIGIFVKWWIDRGYPEGIPDAADYNLEIAKKVPSWRRVCKSILRNDYWCKGLGFTQQKSEAYEKYLKLMKQKKEDAKLLEMSNKLTEKE
jgi:predicted phosphoadenosine phosphosulfate sulfurtransferase